jgi:hypothetical protein
MYFLKGFRRALAPVNSLHDGDDLHRGGCAHIARKSKNLIIVDEFLRVKDTAWWVITIVVDDNPDLTSVNAPFFVDMIDIA